MAHSKGKRAPKVPFQVRSRQEAQQLHYWENSLGDVQGHRPVDPR